MTRSRRLPVAVGIACVAVAAQAAPAGADQLVTRAEIERAGLSRLGDLWRLADGWSTTTVEHYGWTAGAPGLGSVESDRWILLIDDQPVDLGLLGSANLNRLPLSLDQIESVEFIDTPRWQSGRMAPSGLVHIRTRPLDRGITARGRYVVGSETGDPGPHVFTPHVAPNVERLGFESSLSMGMAGERASLEAAAVVRRHYAGDDLVVQRYSRAGLHDARVFDSVAPSLRSSFLWGRVRQHAFVGFTRQKTGWLVEGYGREVPVEHGAVRARWKAEWEASSVRWVARVNHQRQDLDPRDEFASEPELEWRRRSTGTDLEAVWTSGRRESRMGAGFEHRTTEVPDELQHARANIGRAWGSQAIHGERVDGSLLAAVEWTDRDFAWQGIATTGLRTGQWRLESSLSMSRQLELRSERVWDWTERGFGFLKDAGVPVEARGTPGGDRQIALDARANRSESWVGRLGVRGFVRRQWGVTGVEQDYQYDAGSDTFSSPAIVHHDTAGWLGGGALEWEPVRTRTTQWRWTWHSQAVFEADGSFRESWKTVPTHRFGTRFRHDPNPGLRIGGLLRWSSATEWTAYRHAAAQSNGRFSARLPSRWELDFTTQKRLMHGRMMVGFLLRNLFDQEIRRHPIGAGKNLSFFVTITVQHGPAVGVN